MTNNRTNGFNWVNKLCLIYSEQIFLSAAYEAQFYYRQSDDKCFYDL